MDASARKRKESPPISIPPGPVLAVCGWSGSGKTTLLRAVISDLVARGLSVAAVKHAAHGFDVDPEGKDSDRLFRAGADVFLRGPQESLIRTRTDDLPAVLGSLLGAYDLVLVEGHKRTPLPKVWLASESEGEPPPEITDVIEVLPWNGSRPEALRRIIDAWLPDAWRRPPVYAGVLVGGASRRMGRPKQMLELGGKTFLRRAVDALAPHAQRVVVLGDGPLPAGGEGLPRLSDPPRLQGPLAGILGAMRWAPEATWILAGCDQPLITPEAVEWLLSERGPGRWAVLPRRGADGVEPLLAVYDARARRVLEGLASTGCLAPTALADHPRVHSPAPPSALAPAWRNVNTREDLAELERGFLR
jgi:molybdopterin-guanine dinucleotide biosynthesis protein MobB